MIDCSRVPLRTNLLFDLVLVKVKIRVVEMIVTFDEECTYSSIASLCVATSVGISRGSH